MQSWAILKYTCIECIRTYCVEASDAFREQKNDKHASSTGHDVFPMCIGIFSVKALNGPLKKKPASGICRCEAVPNPPNIGCNAFHCVLCAGHDVWQYVLYHYEVWSLYTVGGHNISSSERSLTVHASTPHQNSRTLLAAPNPKEHSATFKWIRSF